MPSEGRERAVTVVIGAVLMFGLLISALALYQVNVVPNQNEQAEWDHHQAATADLVDLRNEIVNAGYQESTRETSVSLGMQYDSRTFSINPPDPQGTIRTNASGTSQVEVEFDDSSTEFNTSFIEYEPGYHESDAPTTVIEHGLVYAAHEEADVVADAGSVVSDERIVIPLIEGDFSESSRSRAPITVKTVDVYHASSNVETIRLPTNAVDVWQDEYDVEPNGDSVQLDVTNGSEVYFAQIVVGDGDANADTSTKLDEFGEPVTADGGQHQPNPLGLKWEDNSVSGIPGGDSIPLTAEIDPGVEDAYADFALRDPNDIAELSETGRVPFENSQASVDVTLSEVAEPGDTVEAYVSSGGTTKSATITATGPESEFATLTAETGNNANSIDVTYTPTGSLSDPSIAIYAYDGSTTDGELLDSATDNTPAMGEENEVSLQGFGNANRPFTVEAILLDDGPIVACTGTLSPETTEITLADGDFTCGEPAAESDFSVSIDSAEDSVPANEQITVEYTVTNGGTVSGTQTIELAVDGTTEATEPDVSLEPGESFAGSFDFESGNEGSTMDIDISSDDDSDSVTVTVEEGPSFPGFTMSAVLVSILLVTVFERRRRSENS